MSKSRNLGEFEILVLAALVRLKDNAYGVAIRNEIEERAERSVSVGALYATLSRLEEKQYVHSEMGLATAERGGRAKRFYKLSALGTTQLQRSIAALGRMLDGVDPEAAQIEAQ